MPIPRLRAPRLAVLLASLLVFAVAAPVASAAPANQQPPRVQITHSFTPGEYQVYDMAMHMTMSGIQEEPVEADMAMRFRLLVLAVQQDGAVQLVGRYESANLTMSGETQAIQDLAGAEVRITMAPDGTIRDTQLQSPGGSDPQLQALLDQMLQGMQQQLGGTPTRPLAVDESVETNTRVPLPVPGGSPVALQTKTTLVKLLTTDDGTEAARYETSMSLPSAAFTPQAGGPSIAFKLDGSGSSVVSLADGSTLSGDFNMTMGMTISAPNQPPQAATVDMQMTMSLVERGQIRGK